MDNIASPWKQFIDDRCVRYTACNDYSICKEYAVWKLPNQNKWFIDYHISNLFFSSLNDAKMKVDEHLISKNVILSNSDEQFEKFKLLL